MRIVPTYGRGYTDKVAERIAVWLADQWMNPILHIQKQVPLLSSDPRKNPNTRTIENLSYHTAAEITWARGANAQVLNEHTISHDLAERGIPVLVYNPFEKNAPKSTISREGNPDSNVLFVDGRDHVSTITISGFAMSWAWLLSRLTDVFRRQNLSIDSISSSETEVTFTAYGEMSEDKKNTLHNALVWDLGDEYEVEVKNNLGLIYCIGDNLAGHPGLLEKITGTLAREGIDIECISQSRGQRAVTIGISSDNLRKWVESLHAILIEK
jgi:aspartokinase/homoserine dehydrogenase 1